MMPLTNAQIAAMKSPAQLKAERGGRGQCDQMLNLAQSYQLVWHGNAAEIRDSTREDALVFSGTLAECREWAESHGLMG